MNPHESDPIEVKVREYHRERMGGLRAWGVADDPAYENEVVERVMETLAGKDEAPWVHSHAADEIGACVECDAAAILERLREGDR